MSNKFKTPYVPPRIEVFHVEMENSIAAASVSPVQGNILEEWETEEDDTRSLDWDYQP